jgi:small-conductance mechanosensitive channel
MKLKSMVFMWGGPVILMAAAVAVFVKLDLALFLTVVGAMWIWFATMNLYDYKQAFTLKKD